MQSLAKQENSESLQLQTLETKLEQFSQLRVKSVADVISSNTPSLGLVCREKGEAVSVSIVTLEIESLIVFVNVGKTMNDEQQIITSKTIVFDYPYLTLADLKLFFQRLKKGVYGKMYDRIDGQIILQALDQYVSDRSEIIGELSENSHYRAKKNEYNQPYHPDVVAAIKKAIGEKKPVNDGKLSQSKPDIGQRWIRQFNNLHRKYGIETGIRMIRIGNQVFDVTSFLNQKALNYEKMDRKG